jgi:hypothetical protein
MTSAAMYTLQLYYVHQHLRYSMVMHEYTYNLRRRRPILRGPCKATHNVNGYQSTWKTRGEGSSGDGLPNLGYGF